MPLFYFYHQNKTYFAMQDLTHQKTKKQDLVFETELVGIATGMDSVVAKIPGEIRF